MKKITCIIPARLKSSRFPKKMLAPLLYKPLIQWTWEAAQKVSAFDHVVVATDCPEIQHTITSQGGTALLTSEACPSGTLRLCELLKKGEIEGDLFVNWQGDEPFIHAALISDLLQSAPHDGADIWTLKKKISNPDEISSPHFAKVVTDAKGYALYFSRSTIPFYRDSKEPLSEIYYKHVGLYAYTPQALLKLATLPPSSLEQAEQLEQLTFLYHGLKIRVHETVHEVVGIDLPEHLIKAQNRIQQKSTFS